MDTRMKTNFENLESKDKNEQYIAYTNIMEATKEKVDWAYVVWNQLKEDLTHSDNHKRSRAGQFLAQLAISDPEKRMLTDFPTLWKVTKDERFVTARHTLQSIWRVALAGPEQKQLVLNHLEDRFRKCTEEKNYTLIRFDIVQGLRYLYDETKDEEVKNLALVLVESEEDSKYKKKYAGVWKNV
ncbi:hypothetical protein HNQ94_001627 [Salirhabdus euzebyi]|uniref:HEAT repeat domain-containing protein n=1 Tax=Salirhabdus euzebyi TaxID=394506 RepID=A0A841Q437_9BACI|nr:hypothetical protein [Salirhabdus euzebyi]MBB6453179.1 hypothetical protein [Salirhabdus euzebyi]